MTDDTPIDNTWHCDECGRNFKNQAGLLSHLKTHAKPFLASMLGPPPPTDEIIQSGVTNFTGFDGTKQTIVSIPTGAAPMVPNTMVVGTTGLWPTARTDDVTVKVKKLLHYGALPDIKQATVGSAGFDIYAAIPDVMTIRINAWQLIPTGLAIELPPGWVALCLPRSGLAANNGITVLNTPGLIDSDYRGEIKVNLVNNTTSKFKVQPGMRIAQLLIMRSPTVRLEFVEQLSETLRGEGGFGSTGI